MTALLLVTTSAEPIIDLRFILLLFGAVALFAILREMFGDWRDGR